MTRRTGRGHAHAGDGAPLDLTVYPADLPAWLPDRTMPRDERTAVLVLPGGGYQHYGEHEAEPVAEWLAGLGVHAFVLHYPVRSTHAGPLHPAPLEAARAALAWIRSGAHGLAVRPGHVGVLGFSAGGHLASLLATLPDGEAPDRAILAYPVISFTDSPHAGSVENLVGPDAPSELLQSLSSDLLVTAAHPPTFLWHTADDGVVPLSHTLAYAVALRAAGVPLDLHVFAHGAHGIGLARPGIDPSREAPAVTPGHDAQEWTELCERWLARAGWLPEA